jgi:hypothetical protein
MRVECAERSDALDRARGDDKMGAIDPDAELDCPGQKVLPGLVGGARVKDAGSDEINPLLVFPVKTSDIEKWPGGLHNHCNPM